MRQSQLRCCVAVLAAILGVRAAAAELPSLRVRVTESGKSRAPVPGVSVAVLPETGDDAGATGSTDVAGEWVALLQPGRYRVTVSLAGFASQTRLVALLAQDSDSEGHDVAAFRLRVAKPVEVITIDDTRAIDHLREMGTWRICARELERFPWN